MGYFCVNCGVEGPEGGRFCVACGSPMVGADSQPSPSGTPDFIPPSNQAAGPLFVGGLVTQSFHDFPEPVPPSDADLPPEEGVAESTPLFDPESVSMKPRLPLVFRILIPAVASAVVVYLAVIWVASWSSAPTTSASSPLPSTPTTSASSPLPSTQAPPRNPPARWCGPEAQPWGYPSWYYTFEQDEIPALDLLWSQAQVTCVKEVIDAKTTTLVLHYAQPVRGNGDVLGYAHYLRRDLGFMIGRLESKGGTTTGSLWRASVDSGMVLWVYFEADSDGCTITVSKGPLDRMPSDQLPSLVGTTPTGTSFSLTPAKGWGMYQTYQAFSSFRNDYALSYAIIDKGELMGTMQVVHKTIGGLGFESSLEAYADASTTNFHPQEPFVEMDTRAEISVDGRRAIVYGLNWNDLQFQFVFVELDNAYLSIVSAVDKTPGKNLTDDVQSMLDSMKIRD